MYCQNCGTYNEDDAVFCESCGVRLEKEQQTHQQPQKMQVSMKKSSTKLIMVLGIEIIVFIIMIYAASSIGKKSFCPERVAEKFFVNVVNGEWEDAFQKLDVDETEFINSEMFSSANTNNEFGAINNYSVQQNKQSDFGALLGDEDFALGTEVIVKYRLKGNAEDNSYVIDLNKQPTKELLFFDNWKVSTDKLICQDYSLFIPQGANITVDGIELTKKYISKDKQESENGMCHYVIPQIFYGTHEVEITKDGWQTMRDTVMIDETDNSYYAENMQLTDESIQKIAQLAGTAMQQIYNAALTGKNLSEIENLFTKEKEYAEEIQNSYNSIANSLKEDRDCIPQKISFSNMTAYVEGLMVEINFDYNLEYQYVDWWTGDLDSDSYQNKKSCAFYFMQENGEWIISDFNCATLYY